MFVQVQGVNLLTIMKNKTAKMQNDTIKTQLFLFPKLFVIMSIFNRWKICSFL